MGNDEGVGMPQRINWLVVAMFVLAGAVVFHALRVGTPVSASGTADNVAAAPALAPAQATPVYRVDRSFGYQGILKLANGNPANGNFTLRVAIYDAPSGGTALVTE